MADELPPVASDGDRFGPLLQEALTAALTSVRDLMPLQVTFALHTGPVLTGDGIVWSVPLGTVTFDGWQVDFMPVKGGAGG